MNREFGFRPAIARLPLLLLSVLAIGGLSCHPPSERPIYNEYRIVHVDIESFRNLEVYRLEAQDKGSYIVFNLKCDTLNMQFQKDGYEKIEIGKLYRLKLVRWKKKPEPDFVMVVRRETQWGPFGYYIISQDFDMENDSIVDAVVRGYSDLPVYHTTGLCNKYVAINARP